MTELCVASASVPSVSARAVLALRGAIVIDLRTPAEFAEDHIPGAVNLPLFDNGERAIIGTLYSNVSPAAAFEAGRAIARRRIETLVSDVARVCDWPLRPMDLVARLDAMTEGGIGALEAELTPIDIAKLPDRPVVFHCWRGGLRSRSVTSFVRALGLSRAVALQGGYKAYREVVRAGLDAWNAPRAFVLRGWTGVGKTLVLRELERLRPEWVIDLEALAGHRSSILGMVGLEPCTQKTFESRLFARQSSATGECVVFEGESRKIGDIILPERTWRALDGGVDLELTATLARRVDVLMEDYLSVDTHRVELREQLPFIEERLGRTKFAGVLTGLLDARRERELVELLLTRYYDPRYLHSGKGRRHAATFDSTDPALAAREIAAWIEAALLRQRIA